MKIIGFHPYKMDEFVQETLREWNLEVLLDTFKDNYIDEEAFKILDDSTIKELIPKIGIRCKFSRHHHFYRSSLTPNISSIQDLDDFLVLSADDSTRSSLQTLLSNDITIAKPKPPDSPVPIDVPLSPASSSHSLKRSITGLEEQPHTANKHTSTLQHLLSTDRKGTEILTSYTVNKTLDRAKLATLIIEKETESNPNARITSDRFIVLAKEISKCFPQERPETYFIPWTEGRDGPVTARGILWDKYCNNRRMLRKIGILQNSSAKKLDLTAPVSERAEEQDVLAALAWLENNIEPVDEVAQKWKITHEARFNKHHSITIHDYYEKYKCLKSPTGYLLIDIDFSCPRPNSSEHLILHWPTIARKLIAIGRKKPDADIKALLYKYEALLPENDNLLIVLALLILPLLLGTAPVKSKKFSHHWKPSKLEIQKGFLMHIETVDDLEVELEARRKRYEQFHLTEQPLPVIIGHLEEIDSCLYVNNNVRYALPSTIKAIDICFKSFYALNAKYPTEYHHVWCFIEKYVYQINDPATKQYVTVNKLISALDDM